MSNEETIARELVDNFYQLKDEMPSLGNSLANAIATALRSHGERVRRETVEAALNAVKGIGFTERDSRDFAAALTIAVDRIRALATGEESNGS